MCRFCGAILGDKRDPFCHACGIVAPHPELAVNFYGRILILHIIISIVVGFILGWIGQLLWPNLGRDLLSYITTSVSDNPISALIGNLTDGGRNLLSVGGAVIGFCRKVFGIRKYWRQLDMEQKIFAFHRINPNAYRMSGIQVANALKIPGLEKQIVKTVDRMKNRQELCNGTDPTDPRRRF
jgi:hypothetical protein